MSQFLKILATTAVLLGVPPLVTGTWQGDIHADDEGFTTGVASYPANVHEKDIWLEEPLPDVETPVGDPRPAGDWYEWRDGDIRYMVEKSLVERPWTRNREGQWFLPLVKRGDPVPCVERPRDEELINGTWVELDSRGGPAWGPGGYKRIQPDGSCIEVTSTRSFHCRAYAEEWAPGVDVPFYLYIGGHQARPTFVSAWTHEVRP